MQTIILAAGRGKRMGELTLNTPKPLLEFKRKTLIEHKLESLPASITEIIITIGYLGHMIEEFLGDNYRGIPIRYIHQTEQLGTAHSLWQCSDVLQKRFMVLMSDDIYDAGDLEKLCAVPEDDWAILTFQEKKPQTFGRIISDDNNKMLEIATEATKNNLADKSSIYTGACLLTPEIFEKDMVAISDIEFGLPQTFAQFTKSKNIRIIETKKWKRISNPNDLQ